MINCDDGLIIGHNGSQTSIPECIKFENRIFWDCPGFKDTKGPFQEIFNSYTINKVFNSTRKFKVVLVLDNRLIDHTLDRGVAIVDLVTQLSKIFKEDIDKIKDSLALVATKSRRDLTIEIIHNNLKKIISLEDYADLDVPTKDLLMSLVGNKKISLLRVPDNEDPRLFGREEIIETIDRCDFVRKIKVRLGLSDKANRELSECLDESIYDIDSDLKNKISKFFRKIEDEFNNPNIELNQREKLFDELIKVSNLRSEKNLFDLISKMKQFKLLISIHNDEVVSDENALDLIILVNSLLEIYDNPEMIAKKIRTLKSGLNDKLESHIREHEPFFDNYIKKISSEKWNAPTLQGFFSGVTLTGVGTLLGLLTHQPAMFVGACSIGAIVGGGVKFIFERENKRKDEKIAELKDKKTSFTRAIN